MLRPRTLREAAEELDAAAASIERQRLDYAALFLEAYEEKLRFSAFSGKRSGHPERARSISASSVLDWQVPLLVEGRSVFLEEPAG